MSKGYTAYIGSNSTRGSKGIYTLRIDGDTGKLTVLGATPAYNTGYLALARGRDNLYAVSEGMTFRGEGSGGIMAYKLGPDKLPVYMNGFPTRGQRPCCTNTSPDGNTVYVCNFFRASVAAFPLNEDGSLKPMKFYIREASEGPFDGMHCVYALEDGTVCAIDLGHKAVKFYEPEKGAEIGRYDIAQGYDPRQLAASRDGKFIYLLMQQPGVVFVLKNDIKTTGKVEKLQEITTIPADYRGMYGTAAVRLTPDGSFLLASTRTADTIAVYRVDKATGLLTVTEIAKLPGGTPRDFNITEDGKYVVTAYQSTDEVGVHELDCVSGTLTEKDKIGGISSPAAVVTRMEA